MVRFSQSYTLSDSPYFDDRGAHGIAQPLTEYVNPHSRPIVSYYFPKGVGEHHYGQLHPMKPHRLTLTNALVLGYGLDKQIHNIYNPPLATRAELETYHDDEYIDFLSKVTPQNQSEMKHHIDSFNCTEDCPIFADMFTFCRMSAGGSLAAARKICARTTDIAINWSGGLHHAKRGEASGFCYVNDIVLGILELLKHFPRVLYIDIDIHHGDGVQHAFYHTNRVMTVSFHKYNGEFFPGTGKLDDNGTGLGKHFCLNVPLQDGINDDMYLTLFESVIGKTVDCFKPSVIVLQCGADSLGCDRLGAFNLSIAAHGACVNFVRKTLLPLLIVGGGGYTVKNVSRCWTYETGVLVGATLPDELPRTVYDSFFRDSQWKLHPPLTGRVHNQNTAASLQRIQRSIDQKLRYLECAPSVQMTELPPNLEGWLAEELKDEEMMDTREDRSILRNEFFEGDGDNDGDDGVPQGIPTGRGGTSGRRARGGRRGRGRGRGRGAQAVTATTFREPGNDGPEAVPPPRTRGRGRGRGRGKGRGRGGARASLQDESEEKIEGKTEEEQKAPEADESVRDEESVVPTGTSGTPMDLDVDI